MKRKNTLIFSIIFFLLFNAKEAFTKDLTFLESGTTSIDYLEHTQKDFAWEANVKGKINLFKYKDFSLAFDGIIQTVAKSPMTQGGLQADLRDVAYNLRPSVFWALNEKQTIFISYNHWSIHKTDDYSGHPGSFNFVLLGWDYRKKPYPAKDFNLTFSAGRVDTIDIGGIDRRFYSIVMNWDQKFRAFEELFGLQRLSPYWSGTVELAIGAKNSASIFWRSEYGLTIDNKLEIFIGGEKGSPFSSEYGLISDQKSFFWGIRGYF